MIYLKIYLKDRFQKWLINRGGLHSPLIRFYTTKLPAGLKSTKFVMASLSEEKVGVQGVLAAGNPGIDREWDRSRA